MAGLTNIKNQALTERIEDHLFQYILDERLAMGAKLPNEYELAARAAMALHLDMNRIVIKHAKERSEKTK